MGSCWAVEDISSFTTRQSKASPFYLYLSSCGICAPEDTEAAGPSTVDSKYLYLQHDKGQAAENLKQSKDSVLV